MLKVFLLIHNAVSREKESIGTILVMALIFVFCLIFPEEKLNKNGSL